MSRYNRIYIAGPITPRSQDKNHIEYLHNVSRMLDAWLILRSAGWAPYCPALDFLFFFLSYELKEEDAKRVSFAWLDASEAAVFLPGWETSPGAKDEFEFSVRQGKKIFYSLEEATDYMRSRE